MSCLKHMDREDALNARGLCLLCELESLRAQLAETEQKYIELAELGAARLAEKERECERLRDELDSRGKYRPNPSNAEIADEWWRGLKK